MYRNPMSHRYQTRYHSLRTPSYLGVTHGKTVKIDLLEEPGFVDIALPSKVIETSRIP